MARLHLLSIGIGLALGGLLLDQSILRWGALAVLLAGFFLRFAPGAGGVHPDDEGEDAEGEDDEAEDDERAADGRDGDAKAR
jgi:hypothetical protein